MIALLLAFAALQSTDALSEPLSAPAVTRSDGSPIHYELVSPNGAEPAGVLVMLQGSGCAPVTGADRFAGWERIAPGFARLTVEKAGVDPGAPEPDPNDPSACSDTFYARDSIDLRAMDAARVLQGLRAEPWWPDRLVVFGGSEGGAVAAELAGVLPDIDAAVIFSTAIGWTLEETVLASVPPPAREPISQGFATARSEGGLAPGVGGHSGRWWADALDRVPAKALETALAPVLVVHGAQDQHAPVEATRAGVTMLEQAPVCVTYVEHPELDHFMRTAADEDRRPDVFSEIGAWVEEALAGGVCD